MCFAFIVDLVYLKLFNIVVPMLSQQSMSTQKWAAKRTQKWANSFFVHVNEQRISRQFNYNSY